MRLLSCLVLSAALSLTCYASGPGAALRTDVTPGKWLRNVKVEYRAEGNVGYGTVQIYFPKKYEPGAGARTLIVLHGYRQQPSDWENGTPITDYADRYDFVLVCPAMGTTLYESKYYPETKNRWAPVPGGEYIVRVLLPFVREQFGLAGERSGTGIFGVSTGARGALLLASQYPKLFGAAAGLSGDYDSASLWNDRLLVSVYGPYGLNSERWEKEVNILELSASLKSTPVFLGHGTNDAIVPPPQTRLLIDRLKELHDTKGGYELIVEEVKSKGAGHDWRYWGNLVPDVLGFFDRTLER
jgi:S-formylglutathione hydrolase FrmB